MLAKDHHSLYTFNFSSIIVENHDLKFAEFIINYKAINYVSTFNRLKQKINIKDDFDNNAHKFFMEHIHENCQKLKLSLSM